MAKNKSNKKKRAEHDFYTSPPEVVEELLKRVHIPKTDSIWEPAVGHGALSTRMRELGYKNVLASDIVDRGYGEVNDFIKNPMFFKADHQITNPPFNISQEWVNIALKHVPGKICVFHKLKFIEGQKRYKELFSHGKLEKIFAFSYRVNCSRNDVKSKNSSKEPYAWYIFSRNHDGSAPTLEWIQKEGEDSTPTQSISINTISKISNPIEQVKLLLSRGYSSSSVVEIMKVEYRQTFTKNEITSIRNLTSQRIVREDINEKIASFLPAMKEEEQQQIIDIKENIVEGYDRDFTCRKFNISRSKYYQIHAAYGRFYLPGKELNEQIKNKKKLKYKDVVAIKRLYAEMNGQISYKALSGQFGLSISEIMNVLTFKKHRNMGKKYNSGIKFINDSRVRNLEVIYKKKGINVLHKEHESTEILKVAS